MAIRFKRDAARSGAGGGGAGPALARRRSAACGAAAAAPGPLAAAAIAAGGGTQTLPGSSDSSVRGRGGALGEACDWSSLSGVGFTPLSLVAIGYATAAERERGRGLSLFPL